MKRESDLHSPREDDQLKEELEAPCAAIDPTGPRSGAIRNPRLTTTLRCVLSNSDITAICQR